MKRTLFVLYALLLVLVPLSQLDGHPVLAASNQPTGASAFGYQQNGEVVGLRTRYSRTWAQNGHYVDHIYRDPVDFRDASGSFQPIDDTLVSATASGFAYQNKANQYTALFPANIGSGPVRISTSAGWVQFALSGASGAGTVFGNSISYAIPGVTLTYSSESDHLKESISLSGPSSPSTFVFTLSMSSGLSARQNASGGITVVDGSGTAQFSFPAPSMTDNAGATSDAVTMALGQAAGSTTVTVSADPTWLADPARSWPVVIDPSTYTVTTAAVGNNNCTIDSGTPNATSCGSTSPLKIGYVFSHITRALLKFDFSGIPANVQVLNADLALKLESTTNTAAKDVDVYQVSRSWAVGATWNKYDGTNAWTTPGGDYASTITVSNPSVGPTFNTWYHWYPTQLVQSWVNGTITNNGVLLKQPIENVTNQLQFYTSASNYDPSLTVTYEPWVGNQEFFTLDGQSLTDQLGLGVNVANGNLEVDASAVNMPGIGLNLSIGQAYNSLLGTTTDLGKNWLLSTGADVGLNIFPDGDVEYNAPTGYQLPFIKNANGSFTTPSGIDSTLVKNGDGTYTLTDNGSGEKQTFTSGGYLTSDVDTDNNTISYAYNGSNELASITDTQGRTTTFSYSSPVATTLISKITDPAGRTYNYAYDSNKNLTSYTDPTGAVAHFAYDANANLTQITDPDGNQTKFTYDASKRVTSIVRVTDPTAGTGPTATYAYNSGNTVVTAPDGKSATYGVDVYGRATSMTDPLGGTTRLVWNSDSHVTQTTDPDGAVSTQTYTGNNTPSQTTTATGVTSSLSYGNSSLPYDPTSATDNLGHTASLQYNPDRTPTSFTDALGHTRSYSWNSNGTLASVTNENGHTTSATYTSGLRSGVQFPHLTGQSSPLGSQSAVYNSYNLPSQTTDGNGRTSVFNYDADGRVTGRSIGSWGAGYTYDANGDVLSKTDATGTTAYTYDSLGNLIKEVLPDGHTFTYTYDADGNLLTENDGTGTIGYSYDSNGDVSSITDQWGNTTTFGYDADGNEIWRRFASGVKVQDTYNADGNLTGISATNGAGAVEQSDSYNYDYADPTTGQTTPTDNVQSYTNAAGDQVVDTYNADGQLVKEVDTNALGMQTVLTYTYDAAGHLTSYTDNGVVNNFAYNVADQVTQAGSCAITYDANSNQTGGCNNCSNTYTAANQPSSVGCGSGSPATMTYPGDSTDSPSSVNGSCNDSSSQTGLDSIGCNASGACSSPGVILAPGVDPSHPLSIEQNCIVYDIIYDGNGQPTGLTDSSGNLVETCSYDEVTHAQSCTGPFSTLPIGMDGNRQPISGQVIINGAMCDLTTDVCDNGQALLPGPGSVGVLPPGLATLCPVEMSADITPSMTECGGGGGADYYDSQSGDGSAAAEDLAPGLDLTNFELPGNIYVSLERSPAWRSYSWNFTEVGEKQEFIRDPTIQENLDRTTSSLRNPGDWIHLWKMGWFNGVRYRFSYFENDAYGYVWNVKFEHGWPQGWKP